MSFANQPSFSDYLPAIEQHLQLTESQGTAIRMLFEGIRQMRDDVTEKVGQAHEKVEEMQIMVQEVRDSVTLTNAECKFLQIAVAIRSTQLTKDRYTEDDKSFSGTVGKYRRMIWSKLKAKYNVPCYNCIRRIDYDDALEFAKNFRPEDYI